MLGSDLKRKREAMGWSQPDLARRLKVHVNTVSRWERGVHQIDSVSILALNGVFAPPTGKVRVKTASRRSATSTKR